MESVFKLDEHVLTELLIKSKKLNKAVRLFVSGLDADKCIIEPEIEYYIQNNILCAADTIIDLNYIVAACITKTRFEREKELEEYQNMIHNLRGKNDF